MNNKQQAIAFYTLVKHELTRMFRIASQVFLPAVITSTLYFLIFGSIIGKRMGDVEGVSYSLFIAPGLIMMSVITNAYGNVSTSLFSARFQRSIEEILVSPISNALLLSGFIIGGTLRGLIVALLVLAVSAFFVPIHFYCLPLTLFVVLLVSLIFSLAGFTNALFARTFDDVMLVPTFILTPLTYLGGVFYSTTMLDPFWTMLSHVNPIWYMVNALRYTVIGTSEAPFDLAIYFMLGICFILTAVNLYLLKKGIGLKDA
ncbi:MAG: ABC transporter permease [Gammaproteobacteria bacterium]|nr:ABC transporter permease [Gammaproteobacteria bacterium]